MVLLLWLALQLPLGILVGGCIRLERVLTDLLSVSPPPSVFSSDTADLIRASRCRLHRAAAWAHGSAGWRRKRKLTA